MDDPYQHNNSVSKLQPLNEIEEQKVPSSSFSIGSSSSCGEDVDFELENFKELLFCLKEEIPPKTEQGYVAKKEE